jgi:hypothetical protein
VRQECFDGRRAQLPPMYSSSSLNCEIM